jgi:hypothetical protein
MPLFIRGSAHSTFLWAGPRVPRAPLLTPSPTASRGLCVSHVGVQLPKQRRAATGTRSGRRLPVGARPHAGPRAALHPLCRTPLSVVPHRPLEKEATAHRPIPPSRRSSYPSTPERRTLFPHRPGVCLTGSHH